MSVALLNTVTSFPLEREFEGWITWKMLDYFEGANQSVQLCTVSQNDEADWPSDELLWYGGKIIGLQFKRPDLAPLLNNQQFSQYNRLRWLLGADPDQFNLIKRCPEIFYCLPTFVNRNWRKDSLEHCIFWRPTRQMKPTVVWYENGQVLTWNGRIDRHRNTFRWGGLIERIQNCEFGYKVEEGETAGQYLDALRGLISDVGVTDQPSQREPLYLLNVRLAD
jgi:hypothetical protein